MAEDGANSEVVGVEQTDAAEQNQNSVEATIKYGCVLGGTAESSYNNNNNNNAESSVVTSAPAGGEEGKSLAYAEELMERGSIAAKDQDYAEAAECYSRALEIRAAYYGELAPECVNAYYKYGMALLYKAQDEADPLGAVPKKGDASQDDSNKDGSVKSALHGESSIASVSSRTEPDENQDDCEKAPEAEEKDQEESEEEGEAEDTGDGDEEDESDLDLAWKMLDVARAIVEKHSGDTLEKVDILSALAEVALEREDVETSLSDYLKALSILERLVESDSRRIAELNFRICLCLEIGSKAEEAIPYCQKALSICRSRVERLRSNVEFLSGLDTSANSESEQHSSSTPEMIADKQAEIETLTDLSAELEKKLEDLQQLVSNPKSILSDILGMMSAKARGAEKIAASAAMSSSQMGTASGNTGFDSPTISTAHTNGPAGVTHLGVVGRGVKRVHMNPTTAESGPAKKPSHPSPNNGEGSTS